MAKFVLAGKADCPFLAKAEVLADHLQRNLPNFSVHTIHRNPEDWQHWLKEICEQNGWTHSASPIVWRELVDRGGKGLLLGGFSDFLEHVQGYYGITSDMTSSLMLKIASENQQTEDLCRREEEIQESLTQPKHIWISSALSLTSYHLIPLLCDPNALSHSPMIWLHLLDIDGNAEALEGIAMEVEDLALPQIKGVSVHSCLDQAFRQAHTAILLDEPELGDEEEGLLRKTAERFRHYGRLLDEGACSDVRVIVAGHSYINLKVSVLLQNASSLNSSHFVGVASQLENQARAQLAEKLLVQSADVGDVIVWGNVSGNFWIDLQRSKVLRCESAIWGPPGFSRPALELVSDRKWLESEFLSSIRSRHMTVTSMTQRTAALSAANGIAAVLRAWDSGSAPGETFSLCVLSTGQFGIPAGLVFSMPVSFHRGRWAVLSDICISEELQSSLQAAANQLSAEKSIASSALSGLN